MRTPIVAGNWKMNGSKAMARSYCDDLGGTIADMPSIEAIICPPATLLETIAGYAMSTGVKVAAQDVDHHASGAHTGQLSAEMAKESGASHTILGHSERRTDQGESDLLVAQKLATALEHGLTPILCLGETQDERAADQTEQVVGRQLHAVIDHCGIQSIGESVIAYEPVWAIGTGLTATPQQAQAVHQFIRSLLSNHDSDVAEQCRILYGGSMKPENAAELISQPDIDGGLVGGASLQSQDFLAICQAAAHAVVSQEH